MGIVLEKTPVAVTGFPGQYCYIGQNRRWSGVSSKQISSYYGWDAYMQAESRGGPYGVMNGPPAIDIDGDMHCYPYERSTPELLIYGIGSGARIVFPVFPIRYPQLDRLSSANMIASSNSIISGTTIIEHTSVNITTYYSGSELPLINEPGHIRTSAKSFGHPAQPEGWPWYIKDTTTSTLSTTDMSLVSPMTFGITFNGEGTLILHPLGSGTGAYSAIAANDKKFIAFTEAVVPAGLGFDSGEIADGSDMVAAANSILENLVDTSTSMVQAGTGYRPDIGNECDIYWEIGTISYSVLRLVGGSSQMGIVSLGDCTLPDALRINQFPPQMD